MPLQSIWVFCGGTYVKLEPDVHQPLVRDLIFRRLTRSERILLQIVIHLKIIFPFHEEIFAQMHNLSSCKVLWNRPQYCVENFASWDFFFLGREPWSSGYGRRLIFSKVVGSNLRAI